MSDDYKIYVDASRPATLNNGAGALTDCATCKRLCWLGNGHKNFPLFPGSRFSWFLEGDVPVRFLRLPNGADATSVGFILHTGLAF
jgi:hypothetical protein